MEMINLNLENEVNDEVVDVFNTVMGKGIVIMKNNYAYYNHK
jgi:hypothetical protein